jgi:very-short-patch-repair endonuclease
MISEIENTNSQTADTRITIRALVATKITFATHQNDVPLIPDLVIANPTSETVEDLVLELTTEPEFISPRRWIIDRLSSDTELRIKDRQIPLPAAKLSELTEALRGEAILRLTRHDDIIDEQRYPLEVLARNEWGGASTMPELLAAFVAPNDLAIESVLKAASDVLRRSGKNPAIDGYSSRSRERVYELASAIWSAVSAKRLSYCEPPASFELQGQKVRMPGNVWDSGLATCLDTTVLFAAAMEQAGLNALIAFTDGHALCGLFLQPQSLQSMTTDEAADLRRRMDLDELILFETTLVTSEPPAKFSQAVAAGARRVSEALEDEFIYALDLKRARSQQITPLAFQETAKQTPSGDSPVAIEALDAAPSLPAFDLGVDDAPPPDTPLTRLTKWKRSLLDLTKRNRLLNLKPSKTAIRIECPNPGLLEDKLANDEVIRIIPKMGLGEGRDEAMHVARTGDDLTSKFALEALDRNEIVAELDKKNLDAGLVQLYRKAKSDIQEGGSNTLYLSLGFLRWKQSPDEQRSYRAPLLLKPVKLERRSVAAGVKLRTHEDEPVFNMTLLELLRQEFDLRIPELEGELPTDESGVDVSRIWNAVRRAVRDMPGFEVTEEVVLSTFSFAKYLMWKDLSERTEALKKTPFVRHLIENPRDFYQSSASVLRPEELDETIDPGELFMPLPADSSQIVAVHASAQGGDYVLEGPPGTGKSQTIANIIAHNLAHGRRVLFVSEKMAALDVVYERLKEVGLGDFCLELHSNKANKREVIDQLGKAWKTRANSSATKWAEQARQVKAVRDDLNALVMALHSPGPSGISPRASIARSVAWSEEHRVKLDWDGGLENDPIRSREQWADLLELADRLSSAFEAVPAIDQDALAVITADDWSLAWQGAIAADAGRLAETTDVFETAVCEFAEELGLPVAEATRSSAIALADIARVLPIAVDHDLGFALRSESRAIFDATERGIDALIAYQRNKAELSTPYSDDAIQNAPVAEWAETWSKALGSLPLIRSIKIWLAKGAAKTLAKLSVRPDLDADIPLLTKLQTNLAALDQATSELPADFDWKGLGQEIETAQIKLEAGRRLNSSMLGLSDGAESLAIHRRSLQLCLIEGRELLDEGAPLRRLGAVLLDASANFTKSQEVFATKANAPDLGAKRSLSDLAEQCRLVIKLQPKLRSWTLLNRAKREARGQRLTALVEAIESGVICHTEAREALKTAYCRWLAERFIDDREPLKRFSSPDHERKIHRFRALDQEMSEMATGYIRAVLSDDIPAPGDVKRSSGYGVLRHQMQLKRPRIAVRELLSQLGSAAGQLAPCMMMSPLSVAQYLSADSEAFDLVVFDEASQITVWDAIGAIARGKHSIIVGDPKQMPPTNFFNKSAGSDDNDSDNEDGVSEDLESILDEALAASVKHHRLTGHYRSRHESLIAFSNHRYYEGDLVTYPSCETRASSVSFHHVDGLYMKGKGRTNPDEAKAVVQKIVERLRDPELSKLSIGVVAMNTEQQRLIENLLDDERRADPELEEHFGDSAREPVFVKNLETVQGDARDVILISIGYGPDTPGAKTMSMNFGPLNKVGGERRLNVAITRATTEVMVFASFTPNMIDLTRTSARGLRDLRHYLEFAERGPSALGEAVTSIGGFEDYDSDFERRVAERLRAKGWDVRTQIGVSKFRVDLGVVHPDHPGTFIAGIECDGATYHSSPTARDRDRVRQAILENLNWKLVRIWSTDFFIDPDGTLENVCEKLDALLEADRAARLEADTEAGTENKSDTDTATARVSEPDTEPGLATDLDEVGASEKSVASADFDHAKTRVASNGTNSSNESSQAKDNQPRENGSAAERTQPALIETTEEVVLAAEIKTDPARFYEPGYRSIVRKLATAIIDEAGPITFKHLSETIARRHSFQRTGRQIKSQIWAAMKNARAYTTGSDGQKVFWPDGQEPAETVPFRGLAPAGLERSWRDVPHAELLGLAIQTLTKAGDPVDRMANELGLKRVAAGTRETLETAVEKARSIAQNSSCD